MVYLHFEKHSSFLDKFTFVYLWVFNQKASLCDTVVWREVQQDVVCVRHDGPIVVSTHIEQFSAAALVRYLKKQVYSVESTITLQHWTSLFCVKEHVHEEFLVEFLVDFLVWFLPVDNRNLARCRSRVSPEEWRCHYRSERTNSICGSFRIRLDNLEMWFHRPLRRRVSRQNHNFLKKKEQDAACCFIVERTKHPGHYIGWKNVPCWCQNAWGRKHLLTIVSRGELLWFHCGFSLWAKRGQASWTTAKRTVVDCCDRAVSISMDRERIDVAGTLSKDIGVFSIIIICPAARQNKTCLVLN